MYSPLTTLLREAILTYLHPPFTIEDGPGGVGSLLFVNPVGKIAAEFDPADPTTYVQVGLIDEPWTTGAITQSFRRIPRGSIVVNNETVPEFYEWVLNYDISLGDVAGFGPFEYVIFRREAAALLCFKMKMPICFPDQFVIPANTFKFQMYGGGAAIADIIDGFINSTMLPHPTQGPKLEFVGVGPDSFTSEDKLLTESTDAFVRNNDTITCDEKLSAYGTEDGEDEDIAIITGLRLMNDAGQDYALTGFSMPYRFNVGAEYVFNSGSINLQLS